VTLSGDIDCRPSPALRHPCCPIYPRIPYLPKRAKGQGATPQLSERSTDYPTAQWVRVTHSCVHWAKRLAKILGSAGDQGPLIGAANATS
jgi:hypothetical protein